ncbi:MAG: patatin-like phospholipase family protein [Leptospiraceae bacterium]|nr:patatin-like phospholipase family protein [Leptospiraceae bacterium]
MKKGLVLSGGGGRGAYQAGVYQYLEEIGFIPDVISGTSVGAINASAIGCGMDSKTIIELWKSINHKKVMQYSIWKIFKNFIIRKLSPLANITPLEKFLEDNLNLDNLKKNEKKVYISAVNILTGELRFFTNNEMTVKHVMASASIPIIFPWQQIGDEYFWDGGLMANTPILPMIQNKVREIVVVLLAPIGNIHMDLPKNRKEAIERVWELSLLSSFQNFKARIEGIKGGQPNQGLLSVFTNIVNDLGGEGDYKIRIVSPTSSLGMRSVLKFHPEQSAELIEQGYKDAKNQLGSLD